VEPRVRAVSVSDGVGLLPCGRGGTGHEWLTGMARLASEMRAHERVVSSTGGRRTSRRKRMVVIRPWRSRSRARARAREVSDSLSPSLLPYHERKQGDDGGRRTARMPGWMVYVPCRRFRERISRRTHRHQQPDDASMHAWTWRRALLAASRRVGVCLGFLPSSASARLQLDRRLC
jgi:hypothetical protein